MTVTALAAHMGFFSMGAGIVSIYLVPAALGLIACLPDLDLIAGQPIGAEPLLRHQPVAWVVDWLHRRNDPRRRKARDICGVGDLEMFDAPATIAVAGPAWLCARK